MDICSTNTFYFFFLHQCLLQQYALLSSPSTAPVRRNLKSFSCRRTHTQTHKTWDQMYGPKSGDKLTRRVASPKSGPLYGLVEEVTLDRPPLLISVRLGHGLGPTVGGRTKVVVHAFDIHEDRRTAVLYKSEACILLLLYIVQTNGQFLSSEFLSSDPFFLWVFVGTR